MHVTLETKSLQAIANAIREARKLTGTSQSDVGRMSTFIYQPHLSRLESGEFVPTLPTLVELERIMSLPAGWILARAGFFEGVQRPTIEQSIMVDDTLSTSDRRELLGRVAEMRDSAE